jgi:hypothetical protein
MESFKTSLQQPLSTYHEASCHRSQIVKFERECLAMRGGAMQGPFAATPFGAPLAERFLGAVQFGMQRQSYTRTVLLCHEVIHGMQ